MSARTVSFCGIYGCLAIAAKSVFARCYLFQVGWVRAVTNAAKMVKLQPLWDWPDKQLVNESVSKAHFSVESDPPVPVPDLVCCPEPATVLIRFRDLVLDSLWQERPVVFAGHDATSAHEATGTAPSVARSSATAIVTDTRGLVSRSSLPMRPASIPLFSARLFAGRWWLLRYSLRSTDPRSKLPMCEVVICDAASVKESAAITYVAA